MRILEQILIRDMGKIMQEVMPKVEGRADGKQDGKPESQEITGIKKLDYNRAFFV